MIVPTDDRFGSDLVSVFVDSGNPDQAEVPGTVTLAFELPQLGSPFFAQLLDEASVPRDVRPPGANCSTAKLSIPSKAKARYVAC